MRVDGFHASPPANHRVRSSPTVTPDAQHRQVDPVVGNQLASSRLGVLTVAAHGERPLDAVPRPRVATDHDAHLEHAR
jgi:hypothetical protein